jgi:hypothetical protein
VPDTPLQRFREAIRKQYSGDTEQLWLLFQLTDFSFTMFIPCQVYGPGEK